MPFTFQTEKRDSPIVRENRRERERDREKEIGGQAVVTGGRTEMGDPEGTPTKKKKDKSSGKQGSKTPDPPTKVRRWFGVTGDHGLVGMDWPVQGSDHGTAIFSLRELYIFLLLVRSVLWSGLEGWSIGMITRSFWIKP